MCRTSCTLQCHEINNERRMEGVAQNERTFFPLCTPIPVPAPVAFAVMAATSKSWIWYLHGVGFLATLLLGVGMYRNKKIA